MLFRSPPASGVGQAPLLKLEAAAVRPAATTSGRHHEVVCSLESAGVRSRRAVVGLADRDADPERDHRAFVPVGWRFGRAAWRRSSAPGDGAGTLACSPVGHSVRPVVDRGARRRHAQVALTEPRGGRSLGTTPERPATFLPPSGFPPTASSSSVVTRFGDERCWPSSPVRSFHRTRAVFSWIPGPTSPTVNVRRTLAVRRLGREYLAQAGRVEELVELK